MKNKEKRRCFSLYATEYIQFLSHFHGDRDYFECHEVLEEYWKKHDPRNKQSILVGFIQLAVSRYHLRRGNVEGAKRTLKNAMDIFKLQQTQIEAYGLDTHRFLDLLNHLHTNEYSSIYLPIRDPILLNACEQFCQDHQLPWWQASNLGNLDLVHRHIRRDRSDVLLEREQAMKAKKTSSE